MHLVRMMMVWASWCAVRAAAVAAPTSRRGALKAAPSLGAAALAIAAVCGSGPAFASPVPEGCVWKGEGEYSVKAKDRFRDLDCNAGFYKGFGASELVITPLILGLGAFIQKKRSEE